MSEVEGRFCFACSYDLRACESLVCPECGKQNQLSGPNAYRCYQVKLPFKAWVPLLWQAGALISLGACFAPFITRPAIDYIDDGKGTQLAIFIWIGLIFLSPTLQIFAIVYGSYLAGFSSNSLIPEKRFLFRLLTLSPWLVVILMCICIFVCDDLF